MGSTHNHVGGQHALRQPISEWQSRAPEAAALGPIHASIALTPTIDLQPPFRSGWQARICHGLALLPVLIPALLAASPAHGETLAEAIDIAFRQNPSLAAGRAATRAAEERIAQSKARFGPTLNADAAYTFAFRRVSVNGTTTIRQHGFTPDFSASLEQPLFTFGRLTAQRRVAQAGYNSSMADLHAAEQETIAQVIVSYANVLRDQKLVDIARENLSLLTEQLDQTQARYGARYATETDLQQTRNRIFSGQAQLELAQGNLQASRNGFRNLVGSFPQSLAPLPQLPPLPRTIEDAQAMAATSSPVLEGARMDLVAAQHQIAAARGAARPYLGLSSSVSRTPLSIESDDLRQIDAQVQVAVSVPLYSSGLLSAQVREAKQNADSTNQLLEQTSRDLRENVASYWDQLAATRRALPAYARAVSAAQGAVEGARQQQLAGQVTSLDVLDTARDLLTSRQALAQAEAQLYVAHALLLGSMGQLRPESFSPDSPAFDPAPYETLFYTGLPTGPVIEVLDVIGYDAGYKRTPVSVEKAEEPGHDMPAEPARQAPQ